MSGNLTKVIARAGQIATLLSERGFPLSKVAVASDGVVIHLMPEGQQRSAYWALTTAGIDVAELHHVGPPDHLTEDPFTTAAGQYHGLKVLVFGAYEPERNLEPEQVSA